MKQQIIDNDIRFRKLIENSFSGITLLDSELNIIYRSPSAERINGWHIEDRVKSTMAELIHPDDRASTLQLLEEVSNTPGISKTCTYRIRHFEGHYIWLQCIYTNMLDEPDVAAIVCNFIDISDKKRAEQLGEKSLEELSSFKYALDEAAIVAITDQKGIINHVNDNFCKISKYSREELIGQDHRIINSGYHSNEFIKNLWTTIANGEIWKGELKNKAKDGSFYWVDTTIVPFLNSKGKSYQYVAIRSDITERKLTEERIVENDRFVKAITDNAPALIAYWTADLKCLFANKEHLDWFNKQPGEMTGISKRELLGEVEFELHKQHIQGVLQGIPQSFERLFYKNDNTWIYTHTKYIPDRDGDRVKGFYSLISDITDIKHAEQEIDKKTEQISDLLDNMTDGFLSLDENMCYTYANKHIGKMIGMEPEALIGKNIWELFPDAVGSATYQAIQTAFTEQRYVCNEDHYEPLGLWQENRVYPSAGGVSMFIRDITKQKKEEQHLRLLESVITNTTDAVVITEAVPLEHTGPRIIYVNEAFTKMTGYTSEEIIGKTPRILQGKRSDREELKRLKIALQDCAHCEINTINYKKNREEFYANILVSPVFNDKGECTHYIAIERDISHQKNEEQQKALLNQAINESLKEKNTILESIGDAFFAIDKNWTITYWNNMAEKILSKARNEVINRNFREVYEYAIDYLPLQKYEEAIETQTAVHFEHYSEVLKTWFEISAYPAGDGLSVYMKNVTDRKNAEITAQATLNEKINILESIGNAFFAVDKNWIVTYWNNMAEKVLQTPKAKIINKMLWDVFKDSVGSESYKQYHQAIKSNKPVHFEDHYSTLNTWYEISAYPTGNGLSVYFKDITERKISEITLKDLNNNLQKHAKELAVSNAELEQFAYVASHDLQEPLRMVTGFLSQLERKYGTVIDNKGKQYIHFAVDGAKRMRQIILDLLEFSRIGRVDENIEPVDLNKIINDIILLYRKQIEEKKASIQFGDLPTINSYKVPLRQVFQNLISNALKYQKQSNPPRIQINCVETEKHYHFSVHDNGIGIDAEYFDTIFVIFQRLHNKEDYSGTGMGLAVTKKIVENLGGKIWLESDSGKGSTFYFTIPKK
jgi:PAS domain S-box-containing protein